MAEPVLSIRAGRTALKLIQSEGFGVDSFDLMLGASGGPKWLVLSGLDRALFTEWLPARSRPLDLIGSSIGAWRLACLAQDDPGAALERFLACYSMPEPASARAADMTPYFRTYIEQILAGRAAIEIVANQRFRLHVVTTRERHGDGHTGWRSALRLARAAVTGLVSRRLLEDTFERVLFGNGEAAVALLCDVLGTTSVPLTTANIEQALLATSAVPGLIEPVRRIHGAAPGPFVDGGILDYHFRPPFTEQRLVFYPHFYGHLVPAWFDRFSGRRASAESMDQIVLVHPSAEFVAGLPGGRIPDRRDIRRMDQQSRRQAWSRVIDASRQLGDTFLEWHARGELVERIRPL